MSNLPELLPDPLPADPFPLFVELFNAAIAKRIVPNPDAMTLATCDADGRPSARIVLCKKVDPAAGSIAFFTNYQSRKGDELAKNPNAAVVFHWDALDRQVRMAGTVTRTPPEESDEYYNSRLILSRLGAWASEQSRPIGSRDELVQRLVDTKLRFGLHEKEELPSDVRIPRPAHWGGYRLWADRVELWYGQKGRIHDRAEWTRPVSRSGETVDTGEWSATRLQP